MSREVLVVLQPGASTALIEQLRTSYGVTQIVSGRLLIVEVSEPGTLESLRSITGVLAATDETMPDHVLAGLDDVEKLSARAFARRAEPKQRPGEGLHWDAPGFTPPGPPGNKDSG